MSSRSDPRPLAAAIRSVRAESEPATLLAAAQSAWRAAAGERVARESRPLRERDGVITVACRAATWAQELDLLQDELLERLNRALAPGRIEGLRFIVGGDLEEDRR